MSVLHPRGERAFSADGKLRAVDSRDVTRDIRRVVWPALPEAGFDAFTGRTAWRYVDTAVDVVNFQSFSASLADTVGCTPFSFSLNLGVWVASDTEAGMLKPDKRGRPRSAEWECTKRNTSREVGPATMVRAVFG